MAVFSFLMIAGAVHAEPTYIGNGGDGFLAMDGKVFLADLVLDGQELSAHPWFGSSPLKILTPLRNSLNTVDLPEDLVLRKLKDLDQMQRGLGAIAADVIRAYRWSFIDEELGTTCDVTKTFVSASASDLTHVQIANRYQDQIRINRNYWSKMSPEHRAALVVHETLYALLRPAPAQEQCLTTINTVRSLVSALFRGPATELPPFLAGALNIDPDVWDWVKLDDILMRPEPQFWLQRLDGNSSDEVSRESKVLDYELDPSPLDGEVQSICHTLAQKPWAESNMRYWMVRRPYALRLTEGSIRVESRMSYVMSEPQFWTSETNCVARMNLSLRNWFAGYLIR